jgi:Arc/MetJ-type ribon-helix-helix transcriptional regulator
MGSKVRINITVDAETVRLADRLARRRKTSRSAVLREGVRALAENQARETEDAARRERQREAIRGIRKIAHHLGDWPATQIVHAWRYRLEGKE